MSSCNDVNTRILEFIFGSLSIAGSFFNISMFLFFKDLRNEATELIFHLSMSCIFTNISYLLAFSPNNEISSLICNLQGITMIFFESSQAIWVTIISYSAYKNCIFYENGYVYNCQIRISYLVWAYILPLFLVLFCCFYDYVGFNNYWCWIKEEEKELISVIYLFLWSLIILSGFYIIKVITFLKNHYTNRKETEMISRYTSKIKYYPIIQICCLIPASICRLLKQIDKNHTLCLLELLNIIFLNLQGFLYSLIFGLNPLIIDRIAQKVKDFCKKKEEIDPSSIESSKYTNFHNTIMTS
jgi:hypothetical protein